MNHLRLIGLGLVLGSVSGCSLVALSDDLQRKQCADNDECESLNVDDREAGEYEPCMIWQCQENNYCEKTPRDLDSDGFFAVSVDEGDDPVDCDVAAAEADCDDDSDERHQGLKESCDDVDNDCDDLVDEGSLDIETNDVVVFSSTDGEAVSDVSYAIDPATQALTIAYSMARGTGTPGLSVVAETLTMTAPVNTLKAVLEGGMGSNALVSENLGVTGLQGSRAAVGMVNRSGVPRLIAGVIPSASKANELHVEVNLMADGLRCEAAETCFANHQDPPPATPIAIPSTTGMALASTGREILMGYVRDTTTSAPDCGSLIGASDGPYLQVNALRLASTETYVTESGSAALRVDSVSTTDAPALLAVPGGYLAGYVDGNGDVVVARLQVVDSEPTLAQAEVLRIAGGGAQHAGVSLALDGTVAPDATDFVLGVAFQAGCAPESRVLARLYDVSVSGGNLQAQAMGESIALSDAPNQSRPAITYNADVDKWAVVYRDAQGLRGRELEPDGTLRAKDEEPYLLLETVTGTNEARIGLSPTVTALGPNTWFGAVAYVSQPGNADEPFAFRAARMVCAND